MKKLKNTLVMPNRANPELGNCGKFTQDGDTIEVTPFPRRNGTSLEQTQCSVVKDDVPLCFTPNGLVGLLWSPFF
ncbi:MAG: hypothetical protein AAF933_07785, partial [Pseudomonadota bacterium]